MLLLNTVYFVSLFTNQKVFHFVVMLLESPFFWDKYLIFAQLANDLSLNDSIFLNLELEPQIALQFYLKNRHFLLYNECVCPIQNTLATVFLSSQRPFLLTHTTPARFL